MGNEWLTVKETAKRIGKHENTIYNMIEDGRLNASKTKEGKYKISEQSILSFEYEKKIKEETKEIENSVYTIKWIIEREKLKSSNRLFNSMCTRIASIQNSDEFKERKKIIKMLKTKTRGSNEEAEEKRMKALDRLKKVEDAIVSMQRDMLLDLERDLKKHFKLYELNWDIDDFERDVTYHNEILLEEITEEREFY